MKKLLLCASLLAALAVGDLGAGAPDKAMYLSPGGQGQVLLFPFYTINGSEPSNTYRQTLISIVNTTDRAKAARLFFHEGRNGRVVAELTLYLTPLDTWTGAVFPISGSGGANLLTLDRSCTVPALVDSNTLPRLANGRRYLPFSNAGYTGAHNDSGPDDLARTREGYISLIELGEIMPGGNETLAAMTHEANGIPAACPQLVNAWTPNGYWTQNRLADFAPPGGGLAGSVYPIDVINGTMQLIEADAIENFSGRILNYPPDGDQPNLGYANAGESNEPVAVDLILNGVPSRLYYPAASFPVDAVSALFMAESIHNEFVTTASLGGASEWVVNFPTKRHYVTESATGLQPVEPFTSVFPVTGDRGTAPVGFGFQVWTRDGVEIECLAPYSYQGCIIGVPPPSPPVQLNFVTNVLSFNQSPRNQPRSLILGAEQSFPLDFYDIFDGGSESEGSMTLRFADAQAGTGPRLKADASGRRLYGMPVQGFWVTSYTNTAVTPGVLANYSDSIRHFVRQAATPAPSAADAFAADRR